MRFIHSILSLTLFTLCLAPLAACNLYFGDDDCERDYGGYDVAPAEEVLLRNPESGMCESYFQGGGGGFPCDDTCGPCSASSGTNSGFVEPSGAQAPLPSWGACESECTSLDELACLDAPGCRGIYAAEVDGQPETFMECWQTDQGESQPTDDDCSLLDAFSCSTRSDCTAVHNFVCPDTPPQQGTPRLIEAECYATEFQSCHNETTSPPGCYGHSDCGDGFRCNADELCLPPPGSCDEGEPCDVPAVCYGYCEPDAINPGECDGEVFCDAPPPACPDDYTPGISEGCYTGYCLPLSACPVNACQDIESESMCIAREDCSAYYVGDECLCDETGCNCASWTFSSCGGE